MNKGKKSWILFGLAIVFVGNTAKALATDTKTIAEVIPFIKMIREIPIYGYEYTVALKYPTSQTDKIQGEVYIDWANKSYHDKNKYSVSVINKEWSYRCDIKRSVVSITDLRIQNKFYSKSANDLFNKELFGSFSDSLLLKHAKVLDFTNINGVVTIKLEFLNGQSVNQWHFVYDIKKHLPLKMYVKLFSGNLDNRVLTELYCSKFKSQLPKDIFSIAPYFEVSEKKVILKQYKNFKITSNF